MDADWLKKELNSGFSQSVDVYELRERRAIYKCMRIALGSEVGKKSVGILAAEAGLLISVGRIVLLILIGTVI